VSQRKRIVILGGGIGALTAAYHLSSPSGWQDRYDITIYQLGWRLGGKCASSRNPDHDLRIEEHGLHVWFGFYENAFRMLREVYRELGPDVPRPFATVDEAFSPRSLVSMLEQAGEGAGPDGWKWTVPFRYPLLPGRPGTSEGGGDGADLHALHPWTIPQRLLGRLLEVLQAPQLLDHVAGAMGMLHALLGQLERHAAGRELEQFAVEAVTLELRALRTALHGCLKLGAVAVPVLRRYWLLADLSLTVLIGMLHDDLYRRGLSSIDHLDLREWLRLHGAGEETVDSVPLRALYDCCFAYRDGEVQRPDFAAGAALGCALRIGLMWRGDVFYLMNAGMGDMVVAPLYQLLHRRGVRFEFFQRVKKLELDGSRVARVRFGRQARLRPEHRFYDPLATASDLPYPFWPDRPLLEQLVDGESLRGVDFESHWSQHPDVEDWTLELAPQDRVVLGISLGALGPICAELAQASPDWRRLLQELPSMQTQSAQLWFNPGQAGLGWSNADYPEDTEPVMVAAPELMDVWADMSHQLRQERWCEDPPPPRCVVYACGPLPGDLLRQRPATDAEVPAGALAQVRAETQSWLEATAPRLWPKLAGKGGGLDWSLLHDHSGASGPARLDAQYLRANIDPSERYVLSPKGANLLRLPADRSGFDNLVLAGDWTRTAINAGCVEATVMSGMSASRALCGYPQLIHGERFLQGTAQEPAPVKIAVLGSGCGAMSAAYWLSRTEELRRQYQVTVYTPGWRLGGKGASGRDTGQGERILEHGLHIMMGFYETAFQLLRDCYASMDKPPRAAYGDWHEAFEEQYRITLWRKNSQNGTLSPWTLDFPLRPGLPGDGPALGEPHGPAALAQLLLRWLLHHAPAQPRPPLARRIWQALARHLPGAGPGDALLDRLHQHADRPAEGFLQRHWDELHDDLREFDQQFGRSGGLIGQGLIDHDLHHDLVLLNLAVSALRGLIVDVLPHGVDGFARIDAFEFKDWLRHHGAWQAAAEDPLVMCLYDLAFAYKNGDSSATAQGQAAAGAMLRLILRMALTYKGAPLWKMRAGMGDIIFTPLYRTLRARGVRFEFFHRAGELEVSADGRCITGVRLQRQARPLRGEYEPLRRLGFAGGTQWDCWPSEPLWGQLDQGEGLRASGQDFENPWDQRHLDTRRLELGRDYHAVVLGIPPAASAPLTRQLADANPQWQAMLENSTAVATLSVQLWLKPGLDQLGWPGGVTVSTTYADPLRSWGEMSQVLAAETWPAGQEPCSCEYLCGTYSPSAPLPAADADAPGYIESQNREVERIGRAWLDRNAAALWPRACAGEVFDWQQAAGVYWRANVAWSELYVQSLPGSTQYRLAPGGSGFDNLFLAGDWTRTSINGGCAEAAFESGWLAARALMERVLS
jgi:uncharacterized protein with NAD-binding domain and iron-sulfur cluster